MSSLLKKIGRYWRLNGNKQSKIRALQQLLLLDRDSGVSRNFVGGGEFNKFS